MSNLKLENVYLSACSFNVFPENMEKENLKYHLKLVKYEHEEINPSDDTFEYSAKISFDLMDKIEKPCMELKCSFSMVYTGKKSSRNLLKEHIVVAHSISYLRELVSNLTMRSSISVLFIDPVNANDLWKEYNPPEHDHA